MRNNANDMSDSDIQIEYFAVIHFTPVATYLYRFEDRWSYDDADDDEVVSEFMFDFENNDFIDLEGNQTIISFADKQKLEEHIALFQLDRLSLPLIEIDLHTSGAKRRKPRK